MQPDKFESPFSFDPFAIVMMAFRNLYPGKECECWIDPDPIIANDGETVMGITERYDTGEISVRISGSLEIMYAVEVFAHELAHVATDLEDGHGQKFQEASEKILEEYKRIIGSANEDKEG